MINDHINVNNITNDYVKNKIQFRLKNGYEIITRGFVGTKKCSCGSSDFIYFKNICTNGSVQVQEICLSCGKRKNVPLERNYSKRQNTTLATIIGHAKAEQKCCYICGSKENLVGHHIIPVKYDISQKYNKKNILVLCETCHKKVHGQIKTKSKVGWKV